MTFKVNFALRRLMVAGQDLSATSCQARTFRPTARWGMPSSQNALLEATKKRAAKLKAKGKPVDFKELLRALVTPRRRRAPCVPPYAG